MSTSYCRGCKFALTLSMAVGRNVMAPLAQVAVAVSVTGRKEFPTSVATPALLTEIA
jgi:hypothetical protein